MKPAEAVREVLYVAASTHLLRGDEDGQRDALAKIVRIAERGLRPSQSDAGCAHRRVSGTVRRGKLRGTCADCGVPFVTGDRT